MQATEDVLPGIQGAEKVRDQILFLWIKDLIYLLELNVYILLSSYNHLL